jgi:type IV pilus assembly protein PilQ
MKKSTLLILLLMATAGLSPAQERRSQESSPPTDVVTLSPDMTFPQAFEVLSRVAYAREGKTIIDPLKHTGMIEVEIDALPWKKAFDVILKAHRLDFTVHEKFYEVTGEPVLTADEKKAPTLKSREVRIEAIFFEGNRSELAEAGIDWSVLVSQANKSIGFAVNGASEVQSQIVEATGAYGSQKGRSHYDLSGLLRAYESEDLGRVLAQPQIAVMSGKDGRIQVGQDFSIKQRDFAGNIIDRFFSVGTILTVTPDIYNENGVDFIYLAIHAERSFLTPDITNIVIDKSAADTHVLLLNGETTMLGGLYSRQHRTVRKGVPYLSRLPWWVFGLRYIFGYNLLDVRDKELIVILRATLVPELKTRTQSPFKSLNELFDQSQNQINRTFEQNFDSISVKQLRNGR